MQDGKLNLLALKTGGSYIQDKDGVSVLCGLDKASVFPEHSLDAVIVRYRILKNIYGDLAIVRLVISEEVFYEE